MMAAPSSLSADVSGTKARPAAQPATSTATTAATGAFKGTARWTFAKMPVRAGATDAESFWAAAASMRPSTMGSSPDWAGAGAGAVAGAADASARFSFAMP